MSWFLYFVLIQKISVRTRFYFVLDVSLIGFSLSDDEGLNGNTLKMNPMCLHTDAN